MRFGYSCISSIVPKYSKLMVAAGLLVLPFGFRLQKSASAANLLPANSPTACDADPRISRLRTFLGKLHCPVLQFADDFIHAADENRIDWRLLPSISVVESGGGKAYRNNNIFGWNNGNQPFPNIRSGIHEVAFRLGQSPLYRDHDSAGKLLVYNRHNRAYASRVLDVMRKISPVVTIKPVRDVAVRMNDPQYARN